MTPHEKLVYLEIENQRRFWSGMFLVAAGIFLPKILTVFVVGIPSDITTALHHMDSSYVLVAALKLALLNAVRCYPHYIGAFFVGESVQVRNRDVLRRWPSALLVVGLILAVYRSIELIHRIHYDLGVPALSLITLQVVLWKMNYAYVSPLKKMFMQISFITAFQFLDVMPALKRLPFGRGETSQTVKLAANVLGVEELLNSMGILFFVLFMLMGIMMLLMLREENHLRQISALQEEQEKIRMAALVQEQENRAYQEMQHLVHDLKSPLTSIQNLVGVMGFTCTGPQQAKEREYLSIIEKSVENMSQMISEILYEDSRARITTEALLAVVKPQVSIAPYASFLETVNNAPGATICVNRIRMTRAVVNLLNNAYNALPGGKGLIRLSLFKHKLDEQPVVCIVVEDNGCGIPADRLSKVWERGYSGRGSHGLGLFFVKSVVESSDGRVDIESKESVGTKVTIYLPEGDVNDEE